MNYWSIYTVSALTLISGNGPPLSHFDARIYVVSCMKAGRHSAMEKPCQTVLKFYSLSGVARFYLCYFWYLGVGTLAL